MKKRMLSLLLVFVLLCGTWSIASVHADSETDIAYPVEGGNIYFDKETGTITDCDNTVTKADIPAEIDGVAVMSIEDGAFSFCYALTSITIPDSVTCIGNWTFQYCSSLTSVRISDSVMSIGGGEFYNCSSLISVAIPDSVTSIGYCAFERCSSLSSVTIPSSVTSIGEYAFKDTAIYNTEENWNKDVLYIDNWLIEAKKSLEGTYSVLQGTMGVADLAFSECERLTGLTLPEGVTYLGRGAFNFCTSLTRLTIPKSVISIGEHALGSCRSLSDIDVSEESTSYASEDGVLFNKDKTTLLVYPTGKTKTEYVIPNGVTSISDWAFSFADNLKSVSIPRSMKHIGSLAFNHCDSLTNTTIPEGVTSIGDDAFSQCDALTSAYFFGSTPEIGERVFQTWSEQGYINIPGLTLYYIEGKEGWTSPTWNGYPTATWVPAHEHSYADTVTAPTCTEKGYTTHTCECGESYADTYVDALGHDFGLWTQTKAPTCSEKGEEKRTCSRCEATETRELAALGHQYENGACVRCGEKDPNVQEPVTFTDVPKDEWYVGAVEYAVQNGLMNGVGDGKFAPEGSMTRAMLVTVLWRYEGAPETGKNPFTDVPNGQWYTDAVAWAAANGIVGGVGNNKFDPEGKITREQMATILYRYAEKKGIDTSKRGDLSGFPDGGKVASWAKDAVQWAVAEKIINGSDGKLLPQGDATRAQVATILMRFIENIVKK